MTERHLPPQSPANPQFETTVRASFARQGMLVGLGARLLEVTPGRAVIELAFRDAVGQQQGLFHGGAIGAIADSASGYAALSLMPDGSEVVSVEYKINFVRAAKGILIRADGKVIRSGRSISVTQSDVFVVDGGSPQLCAVLQATFMRVAA